MGVEIREPEVTEEKLSAMKSFVKEYLTASVENEDDGGRMRWYPWHSAAYRFNHSLNVIELATDIAQEEGADEDVVKVAALFHDVAKLDADQDAHADAGARVAREYLESHGDYPESFIQRVCQSIRDHSYQGQPSDLSLETQCLIEADILDKVGANGTALMLLRMGYESRDHTDAAEMVRRVFERGRDALDRVESDAGESIAYRRVKRVKWFKEWLEEEVPAMEPDDDLSDPREAIE